MWHRFAWMTLAILAGTAAGDEPASDVRTPGGPGDPPGMIPLPPDEPDLILPVTVLGHPRRPAPPCPTPYAPAPGVFPPPGSPPSAMPPSTTPPGTPPTDPLARGPEAGALSAATFNPNMFGDQFSGFGRGTLVRRVTMVIERNGATSQDMYARYLGVVNTRQYRPHPDFPGDFPAQVEIDHHPLSVGSPVFTAVNRVAPTPGVRPSNPLLENAQVTAVLQTLVPNGSVTYVSGSANEMLDQSTLFTPHQIVVTYDLSQVGLGLALPPDGGMVGRTKLSDDNNPIPRDRVIMDYDYYANPLLAAGLDVHRFAVGLEKTFFDQSASIEFRIPFASTLDNVAGAGGVSARGVEWGNLFTAVKGLLVTGEEFNASAGFAVSFPTGSDAVLMAFDGREFVRVKNRSVLVQPFIAALYTPGDRFFAQAWLQGSFDATGNPVYTDFDGTGLKRAGKLVDQARVALDTQVGYWVYRRFTGDGLRGLAPFFELHYNTTVTDADQVAAPPRTVIGVADKRFDEVNASVGLTALFGSNLMVMTGLVVPLRDRDNRFFDYQVGVRASYFYGPTAAARELADATGARPEALPGQLYGPGAPEMPIAPPPIRRLSAEDIPAPLRTEPAVPPPAGAGAGPAAAILAGRPLSPVFFGDLTVLSARAAPGSSRFGQLPLVPGYDSLKVTDNDGPRPTDRYYFSFNQASDVNGSVRPAGGGGMRLTREVLGFETVVDDRFGFGLRLPFLQLDGPEGIDAREVGDLTAVLKYAIVNDPGSGNVCSIGMNFTVPTGGRWDGPGPTGSPLPTAVFAQPWIGAVWNAGDLFVQGVSSILLPTHPAFPVTLFNSLGTGYWMYRNDRDSLVSGIAPVIELHLSNAINNRRAEDPFVLRDQANVTTGVFIQFPRLAIGAAASVPLSGPRPYDVEGIFTASYQF